MGFVKTLASYFIEMRAPTNALQSDLNKAESAVKSSASKMQADIGESVNRGFLSGIPGLEALERRIRSKNILIPKAGTSPYGLEGASPISSAASQAEAAGYSISGLASRLKEATAPARHILGAVTSTIGLLTRSIGIIGLITSAAYGLYEVIDNISSRSEKAKKESAEAGAELARLYKTIKQGRDSDSKTDAARIARDKEIQGLLDAAEASKVLVALRAEENELLRKKQVFLDRIQQGDITTQAYDPALVEETSKKLDSVQAKITAIRTRIRTEVEDQYKGRISKAQKEDADELKKKYEESDERIKKLRQSAREFSRESRDPLAGGEEPGPDLSETDQKRIDGFRKALEEIERLKEESYERERKRDEERTALRIENERKIQQIAEASAASVQSIFNRGFGQESYAVQRIEQALLNLRQQMQVVFSQPRY